MGILRIGMERRDSIRRLYQDCMES